MREHLMRHKLENSMSEEAAFSRYVLLRSASIVELSAEFRTFFQAERCQNSASMAKDDEDCQGIRALSCCFPINSQDFLFTRLCMQVEQLRHDLEIMSQNHEREVDMKDAIIQVPPKPQTLAASRGSTPLIVPACTRAMRGESG